MSIHLSNHDQIVKLLEIFNHNEGILNCSQIKFILQCLSYDVPDDEELNSMLSSDVYTMALYQYLRDKVNDYLKDYFEETNKLDSPSNDSVVNLNHMCFFLGETFSEEEIDELIDMDFIDEDEVMEIPISA